MTSYDAIPDTFIYKPYSAKYIRVLSSLPRELIIKLAQNWLVDPTCYPNVDWSDLDLNLDDGEEEEEEEDKEFSSTFDAEYFNTKYNRFEFRKLTPEQRIRIYRTERKGLEILREEYKFLETDVNITKRKVIQRIVYDHWPEGFNMSQVAQIDIANLFQNGGSSTSWGCSTIYSGDTSISNGNKGTKYRRIMNEIDPKAFVEKLNQYIYPLVISHVSAHPHPQYSLIMVRIQVFEFQSVNDLQLGKTASKRSRNSTVESRDTTHYKTNIPPIYLAFPLSSPYIIHPHLSSYIYDVILSSSNIQIDSTQPKKSPTTSAANKRPPGRPSQSSTYLQIALQAFLSSVSQAGRSAYLKPFGGSRISLNSEFNVDENQEKSSENLPLKSLTASISLCSVARGIAALGPWSIYGSGTAEPLPLSVKEYSHKHQDNNKNKAGENVDQSLNTLLRMQLKAKGNSKRKLIDVRFDGEEPSKKSLKADNNIIDLADISDNEDDERLTDYLPLPAFNFKIQNQFKSSIHQLSNEATVPTINSRLEGKNVFKGLKQFAELGILNINKAPKWLTEQQDALSATVKNGNLVSDLQ